MPKDLLYSDVQKKRMGKGLKQRHQEQEIARLGDASMIVIGLFWDLMMTEVWINPRVRDL